MASFILKHFVSQLCILGFSLSVVRAVDVEREFAVRTGRLNILGTQGNKGLRIWDYNFCLTLMPLSASALFIYPNFFGKEEFVLFLTACAAIWMLMALICTLLPENKPAELVSVTFVLNVISGLWLAAVASFMTSRYFELGGL